MIDVLLVVCIAVGNEGRHSDFNIESWFFRNLSSNVMTQVCDENRDVYRELFSGFNGRRCHYALRSELTSVPC